MSEANYVVVVVIPWLAGSFGRKFVSYEKLVLLLEGRALLVQCVCQIAYFGFEQLQVLGIAAMLDVFAPGTRHCWCKMLTPGIMGTECCLLVVLAPNACPLHNGHEVLEVLAPWAQGMKCLPLARRAQA